jgi:hypothetical protein
VNPVKPGVARFAPGRYDVHAYSFLLPIRERHGMSPDTIRDYLRREPFEPFVIRMSNGETHEVRHPECAFVMKSRVIVYYPDEDRSVTCALIHVNSVEALQAS